TRVVKAFGAEEHEQAKFDRHTNQVFRSTYNAQKLQASNTAVMTFIFFGATGAILWLGGRAVVEGRITEGELAQFILYIGLLVQPVRMIGWLVNTFARAVSSGERIFEVLDAKSAVQESPTAKTLAGIKGSVGFHNVGFGYGGKPVLQGISVVAAPGQVVALLGSPGSGKSTMVHLLSRFYDLTDGSITIDDTDIRDITLESLRRAVGIVQQDVFIFSTTIWENIAYGKANATDDEVVNASKMAQLHDEIMLLPNGYDTLVGERGVTLSGGQRQRLSIARTLLMDPPILVLDDSTSNVDAATEARIQQAMTAVVKGRTTFVIAHRITSVQHADNVVVLGNGRIAESGSPQQLLAGGGLYQQLADLQRDPEAAAQAVWERLASLPGQAGGPV
ncbi:MAG: ABC transporter ATP-binding protein, partial [Chloroflexi bacterium]|nr:ABC transporter ATP-binding protein [Chloroflexota bacterium]